jgi:uncharacterized membrane protein
MARFILEAATGAALHVRKVPADAHWRWLSAGWKDFRAAGPASLVLGCLVALASILVVGSMIWLGFANFIPAACGGFALVGPLLAMGAYEVSRQLHLGHPITWRTAFLPRIAAPTQVGLIAFSLLMLLFVWARSATLLYALAVGGYNPIGHVDFIQFALQTPEGLTMVAIGTGIGAAIAFIAFAISVVSLPLTARHEVDAMTAMVISCVAVAKNKGALLSFAFNIALMIALCLATGFLALIVVFPWLGHATWHAYADLIELEGTPASQG